MDLASLNFSKEISFLQIFFFSNKSATNNSWIHRIICLIFDVLGARSSHGVAKIFYGTFDTCHTMNRNMGVRPKNKWFNSPSPTFNSGRSEFSKAGIVEAVGEVSSENVWDLEADASINSGALKCHVRGTGDLTVYTLTASNQQLRPITFWVVGVSWNFGSGVMMVKRSVGSERTSWKR